MNRGSSAYATRGTSLALPRGSAANPAIRFGGERTGLFLLAPGRLAIGSRRSPVLVLGQEDSLFSSNKAGGTVAPLSVARTNPTTADGEETTFDWYEGATRRGRMAVYRQAAGKFGWRWYGSTAGAPTLDLTLSGDGSLVARTNITAQGNVGGANVAATLDVTATRDVVAGRDLRAPVGAASIGGAATIGGLLTANAGANFAGANVIVAPGTTLTLNRTAGQTALSIPSGNAVIGGALSVTGAVTAASLTANSGAGWGLIVNGTGGSGLVGAGALIVSSATAAQQAAIQVWNNNGAHALLLGVVGTGGGQLGGAQGDAAIYTQTARSIRLGVGAVTQVTIGDRLVTLLGTLKTNGSVVADAGVVGGAAVLGGLGYVIGANGVTIAFSASAGGIAVPTCAGFARIFINNSPFLFPIYTP